MTQSNNNFNLDDSFIIDMAGYIGRRRVIVVDMLRRNVVDMSSIVCIQAEDNMCRPPALVVDEAVLLLKTM